jgi:predicted TIM-barrel fold metal-dependent hydrolase
MRVMKCDGPRTAVMSKELSYFLMTRIARMLAAAAVGLLAGCAVALAQDDNAGQACPVLDGLYFVDAHSQMDQGVDEARVLSLMDHGGVYRTLLSNHLQRPPESIWDFAKRAPGRIIPMLRTKGSHGGRNAASRWRAQRSAELASGAYRGIAETLIWHQGEPELGIREVRLNVDDELVRSAVDIARQHDWPFIAHIEFGSLAGEERDGYMRDLEALIARNPQLPIAMIHMGQLPPNDVARLIDAYPNLYFLGSHSNPIFSRIDTVKHWQNLFAERLIAPQWRPVLVAHPDRFLFALDNVFAGQWVPRRYLGQMTLWWCALGRLSPGVAHAVAHGNAERLWKLSPKPADVRTLAPWSARADLGPVAGKVAGGRGKGADVNEGDTHPGSRGRRR